MKFTAPFIHMPKKVPPSRSWWADPGAQANRETFHVSALAERARIVGNERFGGAKRIHDDGMSKSQK